MFRSKRSRTILVWTPPTVIIVGGFVPLLLLVPIFFWMVVGYVALIFLVAFLILTPMLAESWVKKGE